MRLRRPSLIGRTLVHMLSVSVLLALLGALFFAIRGPEVRGATSVTDTLADGGGNIIWTLTLTGREHVKAGTQITFTATLTCSAGAEGSTGGPPVTLTATGGFTPVTSPPQPQGEGTTTVTLTGTADVPNASEDEPAFTVTATGKVTMDDGSERTLSKQLDVNVYDVIVTLNSDEGESENPNNPVLVPRGYTFGVTITPLPPVTGTDVYGHQTFGDGCIQGSGGTSTVSLTNPYMDDTAHCRFGYDFKVDLDDDGSHQGYPYLPDPDDDGDVIAKHYHFKIVGATIDGCDEELYAAEGEDIYLTCTKTPDEQGTSLLWDVGEAEVRYAFGTGIDQETVAIEYLVRGQFTVSLNCTHGDVTVGPTRIPTQGCGVLPDDHTIKVAGIDIAGHDTPDIMMWGSGQYQLAASHLGFAPTTMAWSCEYPEILLPPALGTPVSLNTTADLGTYEIDCQLTSKGGVITSSKRIEEGALVPDMARLHLVRLEIAQYDGPTGLPAGSTKALTARLDIGRRGTLDGHTFSIQECTWQIRGHLEIVDDQGNVLSGPDTDYTTPDTTIIVRGIEGEPPDSWENPSYVMLTATVGDNYSHTHSLAAKRRDDSGNPIEDRANIVVGSSNIVNLVAHCPGTMALPGTAVNEDDEEDNDNLMVLVNDDDDDGDGILDCQRAAGEGILAGDDEIITVVLNYDGPDEGTITLRAWGSPFGPAVRVWDATGQTVVSEQLTAPLTVDLENPEGPLAGITQGPVTLRIEGFGTVWRTGLQLSYHDADGHLQGSDYVAYRVVPSWIDPGFSFGCIEIHEPKSIGGRFYVGGDINMDNPLRLLFRLDWFQKDADGNPRADAGLRIEKEDGTLVCQAVLLDNAAIEQLVTEWNASITTLNQDTGSDIPLMDFDTFADALAVKMRVSREHLLQNNYFLCNAVTDPGADYKVCYGLSAQTQLGSRPLTVVQVDVDADVDYDDNMDNDTLAEGNPPGLFIGLNDDNDDCQTDPDGIDNTNERVDGPDDVPDLTPLVIRKIHPSTPQGTVILKQTGPTIGPSLVGGRIRIFENDPDPEGNYPLLFAGNEAPYESADLWTRLTEADLELLVEGVHKGDVVLALIYETAADWGTFTATDELHLTVGTGAQITAAGDYIVPGSPQNRIEFTVSPGLNPDNGTLYIFTNDDQTNAIRTIDLTTDQLAEGERYLEWDGLDGDGNHLSEADAPFTFRLTLTRAGHDFSHELADRNVKEVFVKLLVTDPPIGTDGDSSGVDIETITPDLVAIALGVTGTQESPATSYLVEPDSDDPKDATIKEFVLDGATGPYRFYVSPTNGIPGGDDEILYVIRADVSEEGALDKAGNEFDNDPTTDDPDRSVELRFHVTPDQEVVVNE